MSNEFNRQWLLNQLKGVITRNSLFPTVAARDTGELSFRKSEAIVVNNIGIHAVILEKIAHLFPRGEAAELISTGLESLWHEVVYYEGHPTWRWIKNPKRVEDELPPDYDDICWGYRATVAAAANLEEGKNSPALIKEINGVDLCGLISRDFVKVNDLLQIDPSGRYQTPSIYIGGIRYEDDQPDPVVSVHVLGELLRRHQQNICKNPSCNIPEIIWTGIRAFLLQQSIISKPFGELSRYYLSLPYFLYALLASLEYSKYSLLDNTTKQRMITLTEKILAKQPKTILDTAWITSTALRLNMSINQNFDALDSFIKSSLSQPSKNIVSVYRHKKMNLVFGSEVLHTVFGYEAVAKFENKNPKA